MVDFAPEQILEFLAILSYIFSFFILVYAIRINGKLKRVLHIIGPLKKLQEESHAEKSLAKDTEFLRSARDKTWGVEKDNYSVSDESKLQLGPVEEESDEETEKIAIQKPPLVDLSDKFVDDILESAKEVALSEQTAKKERKKVKTPTKTIAVVETAETEPEEPEVVVETEPTPRM